MDAPELEHRMIKVKGKGKVHLRTGHVDPEDEQQPQEPNPLYALCWEAQQSEPRHTGHLTMLYGESIPLPYF
jgi:hypothetical protein